MLLGAYWQVTCLNTYVMDEVPEALCEFSLLVATPREARLTQHAKATGIKEPAPCDRFRACAMIVATVRPDG
jgi:hypothetical protein